MDGLLLNLQLGAGPCNKILPSEAVPLHSKDLRLHGVEISESAPLTRSVTAYADKYGVHPSLFDFDHLGEMVVNHEGVSRAAEEGRRYLLQDLDKLKPLTQDHLLRMDSGLQSPPTSPQGYASRWEPSAANAFNGPQSSQAPRQGQPAPLARATNVGVSAVTSVQAAPLGRVCSGGVAPPQPISLAQLRQYGATAPSSTSGGVQLQRH